MKRPPATSYRVALTVAIILAGRFAQGEEVDIDFAKVLREPLIDLFLPPPGSPDRIGVTRDGLLIQQAPDVAGRKTGVAGFKMLLPASGDFAVALEWKCARLDEPREGGGLGLVLSVFLDDDQQTVLKLSRLSRPGQGQLCQAEIRQLRGDAPPSYRPRKMEFVQGSFVIARTGEEVTFTVDNGNTREVLDICRCPPYDVRSVEVVCTRREHGNTATEYLIHRLRLRADRFFSYQTPPTPWFTWWHALVVAQVVVVIGSLTALARRNK